MRKSQDILNGEKSQICTKKLVETANRACWIR